MINFRTEIFPEQSPVKGSHRDGFVLQGSCFSENIGNVLNNYRFKTNINSHGILFNPESIAVALEEVMDNKHYDRSDLYITQEIFLSLKHHGRFNDHDPQKVLDHINTSIVESSKALLEAKFLVVTFGSAWVYRFIESNAIVANCHKIPQSKFSKTILQRDEITKCWMPLIEKLKRFNPGLKIIFSISPVRHWKDGYVENQLSKANLILAVADLKAAFDHVIYFPAYELVMDDLRDYRFYKEDMLHPNQVAIEYIWQKFKAFLFDNDTCQLLKQLDPLIKFLAHKPMHVSEEDHHKLILKKEKEIESLLSEKK